MTDKSRHRLLSGMLGLGSQGGGASRYKFPGYLSGTANGADPNTSLTLPSSQPLVISRIPLYFGWSATNNEWRMTFDNWKITSGGLITAPASGIKTIRKCAIEKWDASVTALCTFDGGSSRSKVLAQGDSKVAIDPCALIWDPWEDGGFAWMRVITQHAASGASAPAIWGRMTADSQQYTYSLVSDIDQIDLTGPLTKPASAGTSVAGEAYVGVSWVIGKPVDRPRCISVIAIGDSRVTDGHDIDSSAGAGKAALPIATGTTYWGRGASSDPTDGATPKNILALGRCSTTGAVMHAAANYGGGVPGQLQLASLQFGTHMYFEGQINDINAPVANSLLAADLRAFMSLARSYGMRTLSEMMPNRLTGTNVNADGSDQTFLSKFGGAGGNTEINNNDRLSLEGGLTDAVNRMKTWKNASNQYKWKAGWSDDLLHGYQAIANVPMAYETRASIFLCQYRAARTDVPSVTEMNAIFDLLAYLTTSQVFHKLDALYLFSVATKQAANINLLDPFGSDTLIESGNALTFTPGVGYTGNPTTGKLSMTRLQTGLKYYTQDDACYGVGISATGNGALDAGFQAGGRISVSNGGNFVARINCNSGDISSAVASGIGASHVQRTSASAQATYRDGVAAGSNTTASVALQAWPLTGCSGGGSGTSDTENWLYIGASMTPTEIADFGAALKTAVNAITPGTLP